jgi:hypothetical protein
LSLALTAGNPSAAQTQPQPGKAPATCVAVSGLLLERGAKGAWRSLPAGAAVPANVTVIALPEAELRSANKAVALRMVADVGHNPKLPALEPGVILHDNPKVDLDFTLDRGIVVLTNLRTKGKATVRVRFHEHVWALTLKEPGTKVCLEMFGRYPPGLPVPVKKGAAEVKFQNVPTHDMLLLIPVGKAFVDFGEHGVPMQAPPGRAFVHWDSVIGLCEVKHVEKLPEWLTKPRSDEEKKILAIINADVKTLAKGPIGQGLDKLAQADNDHGPRVAAVVAGAVDDLPRMTAALAHKRAEVRDLAVLVLRTWLGRAPGQAERLFTYLTGDAKYSRIQAGTVLFLLFGPDEEQRARPAMYDVLIAMLGSDKATIRELAHWHLLRLAPAGKDLGYDPTGPAEARQKAQAAWRRLIPPGQVPAPTKTDEKK